MLAWSLHLMQAKMAEEHSFGIIPIRRVGNEWEVLLVKHHWGHWGFPKGHSEFGEQGKETAVRELKEETGLAIKRFLSDEAFIEKYPTHRNGVARNKTVTFYLAEVEGEVVVQAAELAACIWVPLNEAELNLTFKEAQSIARKVVELLN